MPELDLRQIDALVGRHIFGLDVKFAPQGEDGGPVVYTGDRDWLEPGTPYYTDENGQAWELPRYSSNIAAAWQVFERTLDPNRTSLRPCGNGSDGLWWAVCHDDEMIAHAKTAPLAICLAALRAVGLEVPEDA